MAEDEIKPFPKQTPEGVWLMFGMNGGIISTSDLAVKIGEALCEAHYGKSELDRQKPLLAINKETYWRIEGSHNRDGNMEGSGAFFLSIQKRDGLITDLGQWAHLPRGPAPGSKKWFAQFESKDVKETDEGE